MSAAWTAFETAHPDLAEDICERIGEAIIGHYQEYEVDGVRVSDVHQHDACNHTASGEIDVEIDGEIRTFGFIARSGNWAGFEMQEWGDVDDVGTYEPPEPDPMVAVPQYGAHKGIWARWDHMRRQPWYQDMVRGYNYDRHVSPGGKTRQHYEAQARKHGLRWCNQSSVSSERKAAPPAPPKPRKLTRAEKADSMIEAMRLVSEMIR